MSEQFNRIPAENLFATEIGIGGAPLPSNGPGRKSPILKYVMLAGMLVGVGMVTYYIIKSQIKSPKLVNNE